MTLQQLRYIVRISECSSFSEAAKKLYLSQPSISSLVKELETELGITIFIRQNRGISLTMDGAQLVQYARQMLECEDDIRLAFHHSNRNIPAVFSVSSQHYTFIENTFLELLRRGTYDSYRFRLKETTTTAIFQDLVTWQSEIGIIAIGQQFKKQLDRILKENGLEFHFLFSGWPRVFLSLNHPLAGREEVDLKDLEPYPCIVYDQKDNMFYPFSEEPQLFKQTPRKVICISDLYMSGNVMDQLNGYDIGTGILPANLKASYASPKLKDGISYSIGWISRGGCPMSPIATDFIELLKDVLHDQYQIDV